MKQNISIVLAKADILLNGNVMSCQFHIESIPIERRAVPVSKILSALLFVMKAKQMLTIAAADASTALQNLSDESARISPHV